jgi:hypothetical protein
VLCSACHEEGTEGYMASGTENTFEAVLRTWLEAEHVVERRIFIFVIAVLAAKIPICLNSHFSLVGLRLKVSQSSYQLQVTCSYDFFEMRRDSDLNSK